jgi:tetratricopeptide (TPR) repeat protein
MLHSLCWELHAHPEEVAALTVGCFSPAAFSEFEASRREKTPRSLEELEERIQHLPFPTLSSGELGDLKTLAYISSLWAMGADQEPRLRPYLAMAYGERARFLMDSGYLTEAETPARTALELLGDDIVSVGDMRTYTTAILALAERDVWKMESSLDVRHRSVLALSPKNLERQRRQFRWGLRRVERYLINAEITWPYQTWALAHAARYAYGTGLKNRAVEWAEQAYHVIDPNGTDGEEDRWARRALWMRLLLRAGRTAEAVNVIPLTDLSLIPTLPVRQAAASALLVRAEALYQLNSRQEADEQVEQVQRESITNNWHELQVVVNSLLL